MRKSPSLVSTVSALMILTAISQVGLTQTPSPTAQQPAAPASPTGTAPPAGASPSSGKPIHQASSQNAPATAVPPSEHLSSYLGVAVYPAKGQTSQQQTLDEKDCFDWAKAQTGIDPATLTQNAAPQAQQTPTDQNASEAGKGSRAKGAARGAAAGAAIGAIAGDTGQGAAIGAVAGTAQGGRAKRQAEAQQQNQAKTEQETQQAAAADRAKAQKQSYNNAFSACLSGKGYSVK